MKEIMDTSFSQNFVLIILATSIVLTSVFAYLLIKFKKQKDKIDSSKSILYISTILLTILTVAISIFTKLKEERLIENITRHKQENLNIELSKLQQKILTLTSARDSIFNKYVKNDTINFGKVNTTEYQQILDSRISRIENEFKIQKEITTSLRQAINPIKPDEILTIARLKDEILELNKNVNSLNENLKIRQQNFEDSVKREISSSNSSTTLILVVLIPLVLNFLYTVWKDFKKPDKE